MALGFMALARSAYYVGKDKKDENRRLVVPVKNNHGGDNEGLAFHIDRSDFENIDRQKIETISIKYETMPDYTNANDLMADDGRSAPKTHDAEVFLTEQLSGGEKDSNTLLDMGETKGISRWTLYRVKDKMGIRDERKGFGRGSKVYWSLLPQKGRGEGSNGPEESPWYRPPSSTPPPL